MTILIIIGALCVFIGIIIGAASNIKAKKELEEDYKHKKIIEQNDITSPPYKIGDYFNDGKHQGYVFCIKEGGYHGKIIALHEDSGQWSKNKISYGCTLSTPITTSSRTNGKENKATIERMGFYNEYPIIESIKYGYSYTKTDYYLPAIDELKVLSANRMLINKSIESKRGTYRSAEKISTKYLSSTEKNNKILYFNFSSNSILEEDMDAEKEYRLAYEF